MRKYEPKTRYKFSKNRVLLLLWTMKYRFVSSDILAVCLNKDRSTIYERLNVLVEQGYVAKLYDKTYRFKQRPVIYYLAPAGIRYLKTAGYERTQLHYKNKDFTDKQIDEQLLLGEIARAIRKPYGDNFSLYTKYQLGADDFYLSPPPYAKLIGKKNTIPDYFIEYFHNRFVGHHFRGIMFISNRTFFGWKISTKKIRFLVVRSILYFKCSLLCTCRNIRSDSSSNRR